MKKMNQEQRARDGSVLVIVLLLTVILFALTALVGRDALSNMGYTSGTMDRKQAHYAAFAGLQDAIAHLNNSTDKTYGVPNVTVSGPLPDNPRLSYSCLMVNNIYGDLPATLVPKGAVKLNSTAIYTDTGVARRMSGLMGCAVQFNPSFDQAILGSKVTLTNSSRTEAFDFKKYTGGDRDQGWFGLSASNISNVQACQDPLWKAGGKVVANNNITINTQGFVDGDLAYVPHATTVVGPMGNITVKPAAPTVVANVDYAGNLLTTAGNVVPPALPPFDANATYSDVADFSNPVTTQVHHGNNTVNITYNAPKQLAPGPYQNVTVPHGQTMLLTKGTYYFADTVDVKGTVLLDNSGQVVIYVGKHMVVSGSGGGFVNGVDKWGNESWASPGDINFYGSPTDLQTYFCDKFPTNTSINGNVTAVNGSTLNMTGGRATMVAGGANLQASLDGGARLLGSLLTNASAVLNNKSTVEFDSNLAGQSSSLRSQWKLTGVCED